MFVALVIQRTKRLRPIKLSSSHVISYKAWFSANLYWTQNVCFNILSNFIWNIPHFKMNSAGYYNKCTEVSCKVPVVLVRFLIKLQLFQEIFEKNTQTSNLIKIRLVGAQLFRAYRQTDRRTDMTKLIVAFVNFVNASRNQQMCNVFMPEMNWHLI